MRKMYKIAEHEDQKSRKKLKNLYRKFDSQILNSFFDSSMGNAFFDNCKEPCIAVISIGNFYFIAGDPNNKNREKLL